MSTNQENKNGCQIYKSKTCPACDKTKQAIEHLIQNLSSSSTTRQPVDPSKLWNIITVHCTTKERMAIWDHIATIALQDAFRALYGPKEWKGFVARAKQFRSKQELP